MVQDVKLSDTGNVPGPSRVSSTLLLIAISMKVGINVMAALCQKVLDECGNVSSTLLLIAISMKVGINVMAALCQKVLDECGNASEMDSRYIG